MELLVLPEFGTTSNADFADFNQELTGCEHWILSNSTSKIKCGSGYGYHNFKNNYSVTISPQFERLLQFPLNEVITTQIESDINLQLDKLFWGLDSVFNVINKDETKKFLIEIGLDLGVITDTFLNLNKIISSQFPQESIKCFIEKFDDPETGDHFISVYIRKNSYPDDFIDKIWEIRDILSSYDHDNTWLLITTDYIPLLE
jgi:hypothetical protein